MNERRKNVKEENGPEKPQCENKIPLKASEQNGLAMP